MGNLFALYGSSVDLEKQTLRIEKLKKAFAELFGTDCFDVFSSSGRIELLGNHTDHNRGRVLVGAVDCDIIAACSKREDGRIIVKSAGYKDISMHCSETEKRESEKGESVALIRGILKGFVKNGYAVGGINVLMESNIYRGAGVSSSAAYEVLFCNIFSSYYCGGAVKPLQAAKISQFAESEYFGKPCGLLDQCGIAFGGINRIDFADPENPLVSTFQPKFKDLSIVITNCGGDHTHLTHEYGAVKNDMLAVSGYFGRGYLSEVSEKVFYENAASLRKSFGGRAMLRAIHFFEENKRVDTAAVALENGDIATFLDCVNKSGESSYKLLQNCFAQGDAYQGIPLALELSKRYLCGTGAVRVHGGGFAGTIIAFVPKEKLLGYIDYMKSVFGTDSVMRLTVRNSGTAKVEI